jgi:hypothetical protein
MRICTFRIFLEQRAVINFPTLKALRAFAIAVELKLVYETEPLALSIGYPTSGVAQRAMREAAPHARGVSKARQL